MKYWSTDDGCSASILDTLHLEEPALFSSLFQRQTAAGIIDRTAVVLAKLLRTRNTAVERGTFPNPRSKTPRYRDVHSYFRVLQKSQTGARLTRRSICSDVSSGRGHAENHEGRIANDFPRLLSDRVTRAPFPPRFRNSRVHVLTSFPF